MKRLVLITMLSLSALLMQARSLVLTLNDGTKAYYPITAAQRPVLCFTDGKLSVETQSYLFTDIREFRVSDEDGPTGICSTEIRPKLEGNRLWIDTEVKVAVYDTGGRKQSVDIEKAAGGQIVSLASLLPGLYIVHAGKTTFKYVKK